MASTRLRIKSNTLPIRVESGDLIVPEEIGSKIENMYLTMEGTLRSVWGPLPYVPEYSTGGPLYATLYGIFHAVVGEDLSREILLVQEADTLKVFEGWNAGPGGGGTVWRNLIAPVGASDIKAEFGADDRPRFPTQFESTPTGVVIIPSGDNARPYFYDGRTILPLGYTSAPGAPVGHGPTTKGDREYDHRGAIGIPGGVAGSKAGFARIGSVSLDSIVTSDLGRLSAGAWYGAYQWIDIWGNLSPLSGRSAAVATPSSPSLLEIEDKRYLLFWEGIEPGPDGTVGRVFCRTKDTLNSGTVEMFRVPAGIVGRSPLNATAPDVTVQLGFTSIPDNITTTFPDNIPDDTLILQPKEVVAVSPFKLYTLAFGRGWAANFADEPGKIHPTMPGRWGTFLENEEIYPDPRGAAITGMLQVPDGLLAFTNTSTFLVSVSYGGEGFQSKTIHPRIGCVAPSSISMMPSGAAIWLGKEGFYAYKEGAIQLISQAIHKEVAEFNTARTIQATAAFDVREQKYRCWVPTNGSRKNNVCWEYDGEGWARRTDVMASAVCVTQDHRSYMLAVGEAQKSGQSFNDGVWLLDHQVQSWEPQARASIIQTSWMRVLRSEGRGSPMTVYLWLREAGSGTLTVEVERDWRAGIVQTTTATLHPTDDIPPFWDVAKWGELDSSGDPLTWKSRRPYWTRVDIHAPSAEVFRLKLTNTVSWEFLGLAFDEVPKTDTLRSAPK